MFELDIQCVTRQVQVFHGGIANPTGDFLREANAMASLRRKMPIAWGCEWYRLERRVMNESVGVQATHKAMLC